MLYLDVQKKSDGSIVRLIYRYETQEEYSLLSGMAGMTHKKGNIMTSTADWYNVYQIVNYYGDRNCKLSDDCYKWLMSLWKKHDDIIFMKYTGTNLRIEGLYDYQNSDVAIMKKAERLINANEMGLGKTIETIKATENDRKTLIVCPKSVMKNWYNEITKWTDKKATIIEGSKERKLAQLNNQKWADYIIVNYALIREGTPYVKNLENKFFDSIIFDEAHRLKSRRSLQFKGAKNLKSKNLYLLTGSPIMNHPHELWCLLHLIDPVRFNAYWNFVGRFCELRESYFSPAPEIVGVKNEDVLKDILQSMMIRHNKKEVLDQLPDKHYKFIELPLEGELKKLYKQLDKINEFTYNGRTFSASSELHKLIMQRQLCLSPNIFDDEKEYIDQKTQFILDTIEDSNSKIVVFSTSKKYIDVLESILNKRNIPYKALTGATKDRQEVIDTFTTNDTYRLFLGTIQAGGEGINLQVADTLIFTDKMWSPAMNDQAEARIHRIGQKNNVNIISLGIEGTVDYYVEKVLTEKKDIISKVMFYDILSCEMKK